MRQHIVTLAVVLGACAPDVDAHLDARFVVRPIRLLMDPDVALCEPAILEAIAYWRVQGATFTFERATGFEAALFDRPVSGTVALVPMTVSMKKGSLTRAGRTDPAFTANGDIHAARVQLNVCRAEHLHHAPLTLKHELGHVLGLVHVRARGNLMCERVECSGEALTDEQRDWAMD